MQASKEFYGEQYHWIQKYANLGTVLHSYVKLHYIKTPILPWIIKQDQKSDNHDEASFRPAFPKLWSVDHRWSSGSALVVLLDWTLVQKQTEKIKLTWTAYHTVQNLKQFAFKGDKSMVVRRTFWLIKVVPTWKKFGKRWFRPPKSPDFTRMTGLVLQHYHINWISLKPYYTHERYRHNSLSLTHIYSGYLPNINHNRLYTD
jgi:hypothetical protein